MQMKSVAIAILLVAGTVHADKAMWTSAGAGCVPDDQTILGAAYTIAGGSVSLLPGANGPATFYCPITKMGRNQVVYSQGQYEQVFTHACPDQQYRLRLTYTDGDGRWVGGNVKAELFESQLETGAVVSTGARINSSDVSATSPTSQTFVFTRSIEYDNAFYYVRVDLSRASMSSPTFHGVALECASRNSL